MGISVGGAQQALVDGSRLTSSCWSKPRSHDNLHPHRGTEQHVQLPLRPPASWQWIRLRWRTTSCWEKVSVLPHISMLNCWTLWLMQTIPFMHLTPFSRERNREHARNTRIRKKNHVDAMVTRLEELRNEVCQQVYCLMTCWFEH